MSKVFKQVGVKLTKEQYEIVKHMARTFSVSEAEIMRSAMNTYCAYWKSNYGFDYEWPSAEIKRGNPDLKK